MHLGIDINLLFKSSNSNDLNEETISILKELGTTNYVFVKNNGKNNEQIRKSIAKILKEKNIPFEEVICIPEEQIDNMFSNRNITFMLCNTEDYLYKKNTKVVYVGEDKPGVLSFQDIDSAKEYIHDEIEKIKQNIIDPITVISGIPSIDKIWQRKYTIEQSTIRLPKKNLYDYIYSNVCNNLDAPAIIYFDNKFSFGYIFNEIDKFASKLRNEYQVGRGDVITICMPNIPEALITFMAINKIGAVSLLLHPLLKGEEIQSALIETESKIIVTTETSENEIAKILPSTKVERMIVAGISRSMSLPIKCGYNLVQNLGKIKRSCLIKRLKIASKLTAKKYTLIASNINSEIQSMSITTTPLKEKWSNKTNRNNAASQYNAGDISVLIKTGGTTGTPKLAALTNENCIANIEQLKYTIPSYKQLDVIEGITPIFHGFGLVDTMLTAWSVNMAIDLHPKYDKVRFNKAVLKNKPTIILGPPTLYKAMIQSPIYVGKDLPFLKVLVSGSDKLDPSLRHDINHWKKEHNAENPIFCGLGLTEGTAAISFTGLDSLHEDSVGYPLPLNNIKVVSLEDGHELGYNEAGELCISGPTVMQKYFNNPNETDLVITTENGKKWLHTGDICSILENGEIKYIDRKKGIIIVSGVNVYRSEIENVVNSLKEVEASAAIAIPHPYKMNVPKVYVVLKNGITLTDSLKFEFAEYCNSRLDKYHKIHEFEQIDAMPLSKLNKIDYVALEAKVKTKKKV